MVPNYLGGQIVTAFSLHQHRPVRRRRNRLARPICAVAVGEMYTDVRPGRRIAAHGLIIRCCRSPALTPGSAPETVRSVGRVRRGGSRSVRYSRSPLPGGVAAEPLSQLARPEPPRRERWLPRLQRRPSRVGWRPSGSGGVGLTKLVITDILSGGRI
jgi:hypothetical protein